MRALLSRLRALLRPRQIERDTDDEIASHLQEAADDYIARGWSPAEARLAALRDFGGVSQVKQVHRDQRTFGWVEDAAQDVRYGFRRLIRDRAATAVCVMTLALGIGVSTALMSVIDATMLRPLPYPHPEQLVTVSVEEDEPDGKSQRPSPSMADMRLWQSADDVFSSVAGWGGAFRGRIVEGSTPQRLPVNQITEAYLSMHGVVPVLGRDFSRVDCEPGAAPVALIGYGYWQSQYGGRSDVLGENIRFDDGSATIVGVLPAWFNASVPITMPLIVAPQQFERRGTGRVSIVGRLRPDITIDQARERLSARMPDRQWRDGQSTDVRAVVRSSFDQATAPNRTTINIVAGAVLLILLIGTVNVAAVLLARGAMRESELALRASLGAGRGRLLRQLLTESIVLAVAGGVVGVMLAWISLGALVANLPLYLPDNSPITLNVTVLMATAALLVPTALLFGLLPAIRLTRLRIPPALARKPHRGSQLGRRGGQFLIAFESALALMLLAGAGLMLRSYARITATDLGFNADHLLTMEVLPLDRNVASHQDYYTALLQRVRTLPGVASAGLIDNFALGSGTSYSSFQSEGKSTGSTQFGMMPGYLETLGARVRHGRLLSDADYVSGFRGAVINQSAARALFSTEAAVGRRFTKTDTEWTVIGVIADIRHRGPVDDRGKGEAQIFFPFAPARADRIQAMSVVMRVNRATPDLTAQLRQVAESIGPRVLVERIRTGEELFGRTVITPRRRTVLLSLLGALGLLLALVGIFGMTAYSVARRAPEIGVRMAFGARPGQVVGRMLRDAAVPIAIGTALGVGGSLLATRVIKSFLFETAPTDPATLATVAAVLATAACLAAFIPARRAAEVDPAISLRAE